MQVATGRRRPGEEGTDHLPRDVKGSLVPSLSLSLSRSTAAVGQAEQGPNQAKQGQTSPTKLKQQAGPARQPTFSSGRGLDHHSTRYCLLPYRPVCHNVRAHLCSTCPPRPRDRFMHHGSSLAATTGARTDNSASRSSSSSRSSSPSRSPFLPAPAAPPRTTPTHARPSPWPALSSLSLHPSYAINRENDDHSAVDTHLLFIDNPLSPSFVPHGSERVDFDALVCMKRAHRHIHNPPLLLERVRQSHLIARSRRSSAGYSSDPPPLVALAMHQRTVGSHRKEGRSAVAALLYDRSRYPPTNPSIHRIASILPARATLFPLGRTNERESERECQKPAGKGKGRPTKHG